MSDEEKPMDLRDKIAIEVFNGLFASGKSETSSIWSLVSEDKYSRTEAVERLERVIRGCYKTADLFRKVRLSS